MQHVLLSLIPSDDRAGDCLLPLIKRLLGEHVDQEAAAIVSATAEGCDDEVRRRAALSVIDNFNDPPAWIQDAVTLLQALQVDQQMRHSAIERLICLLDGHHDDIFGSVSTAVAALCPADRQRATVVQYITARLCTLPAQSVAVLASILSRLGLNVAERERALTEVYSLMSRIEAQELGDLLEAIRYLHVDGEVDRYDFSVLIGFLENHQTAESRLGFSWSECVLKYYAPNEDECRRLIEAILPASPIEELAEKLTGDQADEVFWWLNDRLIDAATLAGDVPELRRVVASRRGDFAIAYFRATTRAGFRQRNISFIVERFLALGPFEHERCAVADAMYAAFSAILPEVYSGLVEVLRVWKALNPRKDHVKQVILGLIDAIDAGDFRKAELMQAIVAMSPGPAFRSRAADMVLSRLDNESSAYEVVRWLEALARLAPSHDHRARAIEIIERQLKRDPKDQLASLIAVARTLEAPAEQVRRLFEMVLVSTQPPASAVSRAQQVLKLDPPEEVRPAIGDLVVDAVAKTGVWYDVHEILAQLDVTPAQLLRLTSKESQASLSIVRAAAASVRRAASFEKWVALLPMLPGLEDNPPSRSN
jgi:hypothetical protein